MNPKIEEIVTPEKKKEDSNSNSPVFHSDERPNEGILIKKTKITKELIFSLIAVFFLVCTMTVCFVLIFTFSDNEKIFIFATSTIGFIVGSLNSLFSKFRRTKK